MEDERWPGDCLFFIAEGDFRFTQADCIDPEEWLQVAHDGAVRDVGASSSSGASRPQGVWTDTDAPSHGDGPKEGDESEEDIPSQANRESYFGWQRGTARPSSAQVVSPELEHMVRTQTVASRLGFGDFIWWSWAGSNKRPSFPSHGTTLVSLNRWAANKLGQALEDATPEHFDVWWRNFLIEHEADTSLDEESRIHCSYCQPSVGNFATHLSHCEPSIGERESQWHKSWSMQGFGPGSQRQALPLLAKGPSGASL